MKYSYLIVLALVATSCGSYVTNGGYRDGPNSFNTLVDADVPRSDGCYAKCKVAYDLQVIQTPILQYTGEDFEDTSVEYTSIQVTEPTSRWVKKRADKNCHSSNPEDCMVWCLVEIPAQYFDYYTVVDTSVNKQFVIQKIDQTSLKDRGLTEWRKVICENNITAQFYYDLQRELSDRGYLSEEDYLPEPDFSSAMKTALVQYQKDNNLPQGQLDLETLYQLGIDF